MENINIRENQFNLQGLLRFALEYTKNEDAAKVSTFEEMDLERKKFLESALRSMTVDVIKEFESAIQILEDDNRKEPEKINAFNVIRDYIDNIDFANNFIKVGGSNLLIRYLSDEHPALRVNAMHCIAEISQNNPFAQTYFTELETLPKIVENMKSTNEEIASTAMHAVSALVRHYEPALIVFLKMGGIHTITSCLRTNKSRVFVKACFLIATLSATLPEVRDEFVKKGAIPEIVSSLDIIHGFDVRLETGLYALSELSKSPEWKPNAKCRSELLDTLTQLIQENQDLPESEEIVNYSKIIMSNLSNPPTNSNPSTSTAFMMIKNE